MNLNRTKNWCRCWCLHDSCKRTGKKRKLKKEKIRYIKDKL